MGNRQVKQAAVGSGVLLALFKYQQKVIEDVSIPAPFEEVYYKNNTFVLYFKHKSGIPGVYLYETALLIDGYVYTLNTKRKEKTFGEKGEKKTYVWCCDKTPWGEWFAERKIAQEYADYMELEDKIREDFKSKIEKLSESKKKSAKEYLDADLEGAAAREKINLSQNIRYVPLTPQQKMDIAGLLGQMIDDKGTKASSDDASGAVMCFMVDFKKYHATGFWARVFPRYHFWEAILPYPLESAEGVLMRKIGDMPQYLTDEWRRFYHHTKKLFSKKKTDEEENVAMEERKKLEKAALEQLMTPADYY